MNRKPIELHRRTFLTASLGAGLLGLPAPGQADTLTAADISVFQTPAVKVASLHSVFLIAITRTGTRLVAVGEHGVVVYSDDAGVSWTQAAVPVDVTLTCVAFATDLVGWAAGHYGVILGTVDGGKTWHVQLNGLQVNQLALADAQAVAANPPAANPSPALTLALKRASFFDTLGPDKPFLCMVVLGPQKLLVLGAYRMAMMTTDGGKTWADWSLHMYDRLSHDLYGVSVIGQDIYIACETGLVFRSTDGGEIFPQVASPANATLFGVIGGADGSVIVYGVAGNCYRSTDQGRSWTAVTLGTQDDLVAARALSAGAILMASEAGGLFVSRDNGASFTAVPGFPHMSVADFQPVSSDRSLIVVGAAGSTQVPLAI
jgi:photosystem II stability/assembly factor-like uncharacterized protein